MKPYTTLCRYAIAAEERTAATCYNARSEYYLCACPCSSCGHQLRTRCEDCQTRRCFVERGEIEP